jgi:alanyl-tRNA synthetase
MKVNEEIWEKFGPISCTLNVDEAGDLEKVWADIAGKIGKPVEEVKEAVEPVKELYIILDHTRTILITISDGALPSNVGGGGNVRNILRRVFSIMKKNDWWSKFGMEGFLKIFELHKKDLEGIYGVFPEYKSFGEII